jgi:RHS repeat-associated protein
MHIIKNWKNAPKWLAACLLTFGATEFGRIAWGQDTTGIFTSKVVVNSEQVFDGTSFWVKPNQTSTIPLSCTAIAPPVPQNELHTICPTYVWSLDPASNLASVAGNGQNGILTFNAPGDVSGCDVTVKVQMSYVEKDEAGNVVSEANGGLAGAQTVVKMISFHIENFTSTDDIPEVPNLCPNSDWNLILDAETASCCPGDSISPCSQPQCANGLMASPMLGSIRWVANFGRPAPGAMVAAGVFELHYAKPSPIIFSPNGLTYRHNFNARIVRQETKDGRDLVSVTCPDMSLATYAFDKDASEGFATGAHRKHSIFLRRLNSVGTPATAIGKTAIYELATPAGSCLRFDAKTGKLESLRQRDGRVILPESPEANFDIVKDKFNFTRQVHTSMGLADLVPEKFGYEVRFYSPEDLSGEMTKDGLYGLAKGAAPHTVWRIENPAKDMKDIDEVKITKTHAGKSQASLFRYLPENQAWELTQGEGAEKRTISKIRKETKEGEVITEFTKDAAGKVCRGQVTHVRKLVDARPVVTKIEQVDPANTENRRVTEYIWYDDPKNTARYSRIKAEIEPDGSWTLHDYDQQGCETVTVRPWLDLSWEQVKNLPVEKAAKLGRATWNEYKPVEKADVLSVSDNWPRTVIETIQGVVTGRTWNVHKVADGERVEITERAASQKAKFGDKGNLRSETVYYGPKAPMKIRGKIKRSNAEDGSIINYTYEMGTYVAAPDAKNDTFIPEPNGQDIRTTVVRLTREAPEPIPFKSIRTLSITDELGKTVFEETKVKTEKDWERIGWTAYRYDQLSHLIKTLFSNGTVKEQVWGCCDVERIVDADGSETLYSYNSLNQNISETKKGFRNQPDVVTTYTYNVVGDMIKTVVTGQEPTGEILSSVRTMEYDMFGRLVKIIDPTGVITKYQHYDAKHVKTTISASGNAQISLFYTDGLIKSMSDKAGTSSFSEYGTNLDGTLWTMNWLGTVEMPTKDVKLPWTRSTQDFLGRSWKTERLVENGSILAEERGYDNLSRQVKTASEGQPIQIAEYNDMGDVVRSGQDIDNDGKLVVNSKDRISESETSYEKDVTGNWWKKTVSFVYVKDNDAKRICRGTQKQQLIGLEAGVVSCSVFIDMLGNEVVPKTYFDSKNKTVTQEIQYSSIKDKAISVRINGRLVTSKPVGYTKSVEFRYDALGRQVAVIDPRTGISKTIYNAKGQVEATVNAAGNKIGYVYDPVTSRQVAAIDPLGNVVYSAYDAVERLIGQWGSTYPVFYEYDTFGRKMAMYTTRDTSLKLDAGFNVAKALKDPEFIKKLDKTTWIYHPITGQLLQKLYADGKGPSYTYDKLGHLISRTWARGVRTTYSYDAFGQLIKIDYADTTPDVEFTYNRLGQKAMVKDALGIRTFAYNDQGKEVSETVKGLYDSVLTYKYDALGHFASLSLDKDYAVDYGYGDDGRISRINNMLIAYEPDSPLVKSISHPLDAGKMLVSETTYESHRNLIDQVTHKVGDNVVSAFDYENDAAGRRTARKDSRAGVEPVANIFDYNSRSEIISVSMGKDAYGYEYDPIGNRRKAEKNGKATFYSANALNRYAVIDLAATIFVPSYDDDGNQLTLHNDTGDWKLSWNGENRLVKMEKPGMTLEFTYDHMGRRVEKAVSLNGQAAKCQRFIYDGYLQIAEADTAGKLVKSYVWDPTAGQATRVLAMKNHISDKTYTFCHDANKSTSVLVDRDGAVVARYDYDPFGNVMEGDGVKTNPFQFSSEFVDYECNLIYYNYRHYDPVAGRWTNRDPIEGKGGCNLYRFTHNNTVNWIDICGLEDKSLDVNDSISETISGMGAPWDKTYNWSSKFRIEAKDNPTCTVNLIVKLSLAGTVSDAVKSGWKGAIEGRWNNKFKICCSTTFPKCACCLPITVEIQFVSSGQHYQITPNQPGVGGTEGLGGTNSMTGWGVADTVDIIHEVGHMLGNKDEYGTIDGVNYGAGRQTGGNLMNNPSGAVADRHFSSAAKKLGSDCVVKVK